MRVRVTPWGFVLLQLAMLPIPAAATPKPSSDWADIRDYGAIPNDGKDDTAAIAAALASKKPVYIPAGVFIANNLVVPDGATIRGASKHTSVLRSSTATPLLAVRGTAQTGVYHFEISRLELDGGGVGTVGIDLSYAREGIVDECYVHGFTIGLRAEESWTNRVHLSAIVHNSDANVKLGPNSNDFSIDECQLDAGGRNGLVATAGSSAIRLQSDVIQAAGEEGVVASGVKALSITGCYFERNAAKSPGRAQLRISASFGVTVMGSVFWGESAGPGIELADVRGAAIYGNSVSDSGTPRYSLSVTGRSSEIVAAGNYFAKPPADPGGAITTIGKGSGK